MEALEAIEKCLALDPKYFDRLHTGGVIFYKVNKYQKANELFNIVIEFDNIFPDGYYGRAKTKSKLGLNYLSDLDKTIEYGGVEFEHKAKEDKLI